MADRHYHCGGCCSGYGPVASLEHHHQDLSQYRQTETEPETVQDSESETVSETEAYVSPIDFDSLKAVNEDIYAWLEIPGTDISYPILQHPTEDEYYLRKGLQGQSCCCRLFVYRAFLQQYDDGRSHDGDLRT